MEAGGMNPSESSMMNRKIEAATGAETLNLPEEIIIDILSRLPVKSLLKLRCVSKSWCSIISNPSFAQFHLEASLNASSSFTNHRLILEDVAPRGPTNDLHQLSLRSVMEEEGPPLIDAVTIDYPGTRPRFADVFGSHNGLLLISIDEEEEEDGLCLWNPTTKVHFNLPKLDMDMDFNKVIGFGYTKSSEDYKVLIIFQMFTICGVNDSFVKIYSQKANSWKIMEPYNYSHMYPCIDAVGSGTLVNGKLHFSMSSLANRGWWEIVYVDLDLETDGIIEHPDYGKGRFNVLDSCVALGVLGGSLCVLCNGCDQQGILNLSSSIRYHHRPCSLFGRRVDCYRSLLTSTSKS